MVSIVGKKCLQIFSIIKVQNVMWAVCAGLIHTEIVHTELRKKSLQILLGNIQAGPGRKVKQEQEEISRNHVPRLFLGSVLNILS